VRWTVRRFRWRTRPVENPWCFFEGHGRYSVNVLVVCDWERRITNFVQVFMGAAPHTVVQPAASGTAPPVATSSCGSTYSVTRGCWHLSTSSCRTKAQAQLRRTTRTSTTSTHVGVLLPSRSLACSRGAGQDCGNYDFHVEQAEMTTR